MSAPLALGCDAADDGDANSETGDTGASDEGGDSNDSGDTGTPSQDEWMVATVDGVPFMSVDDSQFNRVMEISAGGMVMTQIVGVREGGDSVLIQIRDLEGTGVIDLSDTLAANLSWVITGVDNLQNLPGEGSLEITLNNDERIEGSFSFTGHSKIDESMVTVDGGSFSIRRD